MPELPEVETIAQGLRPHICGQIITDIQLNRKDLRRLIPANLPHIATGQGITGVTRRGKYLLIALEKHDTIITHLGMSGRLIFYPAPPATLKKHDHVVITFSTGSQLIFNDSRRFGMIDISKTTQIPTHPMIAVLGIEPLQPECNGNYLYTITKGSRSPIKSLLMDGHKIVGIGNIYACESLFLAGIHPTRSSHTLKKAECHSLMSSIKDTLAKAISAGGSTLKDYTQSTGGEGYFQHQFQVYGRKDKPCTRCKTPIVQIRQSGRSTFLCPSCQS
jgi:formamidopyrimidine-DNA glycosylase